MDNVKNYMIIILIVCVGVLAWQVSRKPKEVVKIETKVKTKIVYQDRVIDRVIKVTTDGTVVTTEHVVEKVVEKDKVIEKYKEVTKWQQNDWAVLIATPLSVPMSFNQGQVIGYRRIFGTFYLGCGYQLNQGLNVSILMTF